MSTKSAKQLRPQYKEIVKLFESLQGRHLLWELWQDAMIMIACAISNQVDGRYREERERLYMQTVGRYTREEAAVFPRIFAEIVEQLEADPEQDFLGCLYMQLDLGSHWAGQFFTPYSVCKLMAQTNFRPIADPADVRPITVSDCACGGGATLIAAAHAFRHSIWATGLNPQNYLCFYAQDISMVTALMCYIQLSLQGYAGKVKIGDTLADPMTAGEDSPSIWYTPMWFSPVWTARRALRKTTPD